MVKRQGKDRDFSWFVEKSLFLFVLGGFFTVAGRVCGAALAFGLFFSWIDFAGLAPLVAAGHTFNGHNGKI